MLKRVENPDRKLERDATDASWEKQSRPSSITLNYFHLLMPVRKRVALDDAEDSSPSGSPPPSPAATSNKRARMTPNGQSKPSKARMDDNMDDDNSDNDNDNGNEDVDIQEESYEERTEKDRQFEEANYDKIMASVKSREKYSGVRGLLSKKRKMCIHSHVRLLRNLELLRESSFFSSCVINV